MKKILSKLILIVVLFNMAPLTAFASSSRANDNEIIYFDDGSYIVIELAQENAPVRTTAQKSKSYTYYNSNNEASWKAVLTGTFTYSGTTASCTFSNCDVTIYDDDWYVISNTASTNGASATAELTMAKKFLGITTTKKTIELTLTCSPTGSFS